MNSENSEYESEYENEYESEYESEYQELMTNLSPAYELWKRKTLRQGRLEGRREGRLEGMREEKMHLLHSLLFVKFGGMDPQLDRVISPMLDLSRDEFSRVILTLNREELLARFGIV